MLIAGNELKQLVKDGVITGLLSDDQINAASIDVTLGSLILTEPEIGNPISVSLKDRTPIPFNENSIEGGNFVLAPSQFILVSTNEVFNLPEDISAVYKLKSSMARIGIQAANAGWCDAGWHDSILTTALTNTTNRTSVVLDHNTAIGQVVFFRHPKVSADQSYAAKGSYNKTATTQGTKK